MPRKKKPRRFTPHEAAIVGVTALNASLTPEQRIASARNAVNARWAKARAAQKKAAKEQKVAARS